MGPHSSTHTTPIFRPLRKITAIAENHDTTKIRVEVTVIVNT